jgi:hypothetical protein
VIWLVLACVWLIAANVAAMLPSRDYHWRFAYIMIALGLPVLIGVFATSGPWMGFGGIDRRDVRFAVACDLSGPLA